MRYIDKITIVRCLNKKYKVCEVIVFVKHVMNYMMYGL